MKEVIKKIIGVENIKNDKKYFLVKIIFITIFAFTIFLDSILTFSGDIFSKVNEIYFTNIELKHIVILICAWVISYFVISLIEIMFPKFEKTIETKKERKTKNKRIFFIVFLILLICWLPYCLSYFPGGIYVDTLSSIQQALENMPFNNHNPILYALIMKVFIMIGMKIEGNLQLGIELFSIFQVLIMAITFAYFVYWLYKKKISNKYLVITTLFFGFCRLVPLYAVSLWKDTPFCIALFCYILFIAETICQDGKNLEKIRNVIIYILLLILVAFLRSNGIYIAVCTTFILLLIYKRSIIKTLKKFAISSIITIMLIWVIQGPVYKQYGLSTEFVENLGVPVQQICYVVAKDGNITEEQKAFINQLCPIDVIKENYTPCIVDSIKWNPNFSNNFLENNKGEFFKVWFQVFLQNPMSYIKAYLINTIGFWNVNQATKDAYINPTMWPDVAEGLKIEQNDYIERITGVSIRKVLEPTSAVSSAVYLFMLLLSALVVIYKKQYKKLVIYLPGFLTWLTIMIAVPLAFSLRYVYILVLMIPFYFIIPFLKINKDNKEKT